MWVTILAMLLAQNPADGAPAAGQVGAPQVQAGQTALPNPDPLRTVIDGSMADIRAGRNADALAMLDPVAAAITEQVNSTTVPKFCPQSLAEAKGYMARATPASPTIRLLNAKACDVLFLRGYVLENLHRLPEAIAQLHQLTDLEPDFPHAWVEYAAALRQTGDHTTAMAAYRHAIDVAATSPSYAPDQAAAWRGVGFVLTERNDLDGAEHAYRESLTLAPGHPVALNELKYIDHLRASGKKAAPQTLESSTDPAKAAKAMQAQQGQVPAAQPN